MPCLPLKRSPQVGLVAQPVVPPISVHGEDTTIYSSRDTTTESYGLDLHIFLGIGRDPAKANMALPKPRGENLLNESLPCDLLPLSPEELQAGRLLAPVLEGHESEHSEIIGIPSTVE